MAGTDISTGLHFDLTDEQRLFQSTLHELVDAEFSKPYAREVEAREEFPWTSGRSSESTA